MIRTAVIYLVLAIGAVAGGLNGPLFLRQIVVVENRHGHDGPLQERGPYQFREMTWRQHMPGLSFDLARDPYWARICAERHLAWLQRELAAAGGDDNAFNLALCWNAGLDRVLQGGVPESAYDYASRVRNLYENSK